MRKSYLTPKWFISCLLLLSFNLLFQSVKSQTCTSNDPTLCASAILDPCANFTGNSVTAVTNNNLVFTGTSTLNPNKLTFKSRTYAVPLTNTSNCVVVKFTEAGTASLTRTDVTITTNTGLLLTCPNITLSLGQACVKICDTRLTPGTTITFGIDAFASTFNGGATVTVSNFSTVGVATCNQPVSLPCPTTYVGLNNDCGTSCDANFPIPSGKVRVFFPSPIPVGQPTPLIADITAIAGVAITPGQYKFCLNGDAGTTVERTYADYCVYTNTGNLTPLLPTLGTLTLTVQSGTISQVCVVNVCAGGKFAVLNNTTGCVPCPGVTGTLSGKVRVFFNQPIPVGTSTPTLTSATVAGVNLLGYKFCLTADAGSAVVRNYADYCIYADPLITTLPFPNNLPIVFNFNTGAICTTPISIPCSSGFVVLNNGTGVGGPTPTAACPAVPASCNQTFVVVSRLRVYFTPCLPAGVPTPTITGAQGLNSSGSIVNPLTNRFCFVASAESNQLVSTVRCYVDYCVYGQAGDTYFNTPDAQIQFSFTYDILTTVNGLQTPLTQTCSPTAGPVGATPIYNPDVNVTMVNVSVSGNVSTNDVVPFGTTYGLPQPNAGNPPGATLTLNSDGTYNFITPTAGVYIYRVPVCVPGAVAPCPTTELRITVLNNAITTNPPIANTDITSTLLNTSIIIKVLANDTCSNFGCSINPATGVTITVQPNHANGPVTVNPNGTINYTPANGFVGTDSLTYRICDNLGLCTTAKVFITVVATTPNTTLAADDFVKTFQGTAVSGNVKTNDTDPQGDAQLVTVQNSTITGKGTLNLNADGTFTFTPSGNFTGPVDFVYTICDNGSPTVCASATLHILVLPLTPTPVSISNFIVTSKNCDVAVQWNFSNQVNGDFIQIEQSIDGNSYSPVYKINLGGTSSGVYKAKLTQVTNTGYYRLKITDKDGRIQYSEVKSAKTNCGLKDKLEMYPNPLNLGSAIFFSTSEAKGKANLILMDVYGRKLLNQEVNIIQGTNKINLNQSTLQKGEYYIQIMGNNWKSEVLKITKIN